MTSNGPPNLLSALARSCSYRVVEPGTSLFEEGQPCRGLYLVLSAKVRLVKTSTSDNLEIRPDIGKGTILGISDLLARRSHPVTAVVVERGEIGFIATEALAPLFSRRIDALSAAIRTSVEARVQLTILLSEAIGAVCEISEARREKTLAS